ncbi:MAG TPA: sortase [Candidatus Limnocylindrales bacterium]|jgi:hypothetical protein|nr:sortase [Candidatus Limnocylindrales bacterium]
MADIGRARFRRRETIALAAVLALTTAWTTASSTPQAETASTEPAANSAAAAAAAADRYAAVLALQEANQGAASYPNGVAYPNLDARRHAPRTYAVAEAPAPAKEKPKAPPKPASPKPASPKPAASQPAPTHKRVYQGTNHFWFPSLGMSYGVYWYACGRTSTPLNHIYRWGCAGRNNVYLLGHAWGVMKPLHDLYVSGGLHRGMIAVYADANGHVRKYAVTEWRVVRPTEVAWQIAAQPVPSMTLQTCLGKYSEWRLNVRLVAVN